MKYKKGYHDESMYTKCTSTRSGVHNDVLQELAGDVLHGDVLPPPGHS